MSNRDALKSVTGTAMLLGCGIAAAQSALELADCNCDVFLAEEEPSIGGARQSSRSPFPSMTAPCESSRPSWSRSVEILISSFRH